MKKMSVVAQVPEKKDKLDIGELMLTLSKEQLKNVLNVLEEDQMSKHIAIVLDSEFTYKELSLDSFYGGDR